MAGAKSIQQEAPPLASAVSISRHFLRSIRLDADFGREDALLGYICQGTARTLLESMARQLTTTRQRAFTWTGPYGGGKSSLALMLCSLVGPSHRLRQRAKQILDLPDNSPVHAAFDARGDGWMVLPVVGKRASVVQEVSVALARARGGVGSRRKNADVVGELVAAAEAHRHGVLVVVDELGKFDAAAERVIRDALAVSGDIVLRAAKRGVSAGEMLGLILSRYLVQHEFRHMCGSPQKNPVQVFFLLDDYATWLAQRESRIADLLGLASIEAPMFGRASGDQNG
jgi:hypothetical protein